MEPSVSQVGLVAMQRLGQWERCSAARGGAKGGDAWPSGRLLRRPLAEWKSDPEVPAAGTVKSPGCDKATWSGEHPYGSAEAQSRVPARPGAAIL